MYLIYSNDNVLNKENNQFAVANTSAWASPGTTRTQPFHKCGFGCNLNWMENCHYCNSWTQSNGYNFCTCDDKLHSHCAM